MKYCKICLQPDTRPGIKFDIKGICPACNFFNSNFDREIDYERLEEAIKFGKENSDSGYDCIIGVSGGKDSTRQAIYVKETLKMNPLLVSLNYPPNQSTQRGIDNISNMIEKGFDCIQIQPSPQIWKKLMKKSFFKYTNWAKSTELALFSSVPRFAIAYQIPLIWWGENPALQLGDLNVMGKDGSDGNNLRKMNTLSGGDITWLIDKEIRKNQVIQYQYPTEKEIERANLRITFLGYFWKDWSLVDNGVFSVLRGLDIRENKPWEIGDNHGITSLDEDWVSLNQMIKYLKFGFGRVTDYLNEDIRFNRISRKEAIKIAENFDGKCSTEIISDFCDYIEITIEDFWNQIDKSVNKKLFERISQGVYIPKFKIGVGL